MNLSPAQRELFELLTQRTLYVVDTEYTGGRDSNRLISIAVVPIVGGRRAPATEELYVEMNPTAPISAGASAVNGFTEPDGRPQASLRALRAGDHRRVC